MTSHNGTLLILFTNAHVARFMWTVWQKYMIDSSPKTVTPERDLLKGIQTNSTNKLHGDINNRSMTIGYILNINKIVLFLNINPQITIILKNIFNYITDNAHTVTVQQFVCFPENV